MPNESKSSEHSEPILQKKIEWKKYKLGEVITLQRGVDLPKNKMEKGRYPVAGSNGIIGYHNCHTTNGPGVTIGRSGNIGAVHFYESDFWAHNTSLYVKDFKGNDERYIYYFLKTIDFSQFNTGSAVPSLNRNHLHELSVRLPPLSEQKRIASILSSLDDKIDLLHRQNATLEAMAETLFRHHFIENPNPDWKEGIISDVIEFNPPRSLKKGTIAPFLEMSNLSTEVYFPNGWCDREFSSGTKFINGDTLLARITPCLENGKAAYVDFLCPNQIGWGSTEYIVMHPKGRFHPFFAYIVCKYQDFRDYAESCMSGSSGRQRVDVENLKNYKFRIPNTEVVTIFNDSITSLLAKMECNNKEIHNLKLLRLTLSPRLMSNDF